METNFMSSSENAASLQAAGAPDSTSGSNSTSSYSSSSSSEEIIIATTDDVTTSASESAIVPPPEAHPHAQSATSHAAVQTQPSSSIPAAASLAGASIIGSVSSSQPIVTNKMPGLIETPQIGNYLDFRKFLSDYYQYRRELSKRDIRPYNYAVFSAAANIKSPNYLKLIIEGRRNLSEDMIAKFSKAMALPKDQAEEFRLLVLFGQASDPAERNMHLKALNEKRVDSKLKSGEIDQKTWEKIPSWIAWILYSVTDQKDVSFEPEKLRETLRNKASSDEIQAALNSLIQSGEIVKDEATGEVKKARSLMESADDVPVALVRKLQAELMYLGLESLFQDSPTEREFGSATMALTKQEFEELRFQLRKLRKEAQKNIGVKRLTSKGDRVYQLNLQLFPISK